MAIIKTFVIETCTLHSVNNFWVLLQGGSTHLEHPGAVQRRQPGLVSSCLSSHTPSSDLESWAIKSVADFPMDESSWFSCFQCKSAFSWILLKFSGIHISRGVLGSIFFSRICRLWASWIWEKANFKNKQAGTLQLLHLIIPLPLVEYLCPAMIAVSKHYCY